MLIIEFESFWVAGVPEIIELAVYSIEEKKLFTYMFCPSVRFNKLNAKDAKTADYLTRRHHKIPWPIRGLPQDALKSVLQHHTAKRGNVVFVYGRQKKTFLKTVLPDCFFINIQNFLPDMKLHVTPVVCLHHTQPTTHCAVAKLSGLYKAGFQKYVG